MYKHKRQTFHLHSLVSYVNILDHLSAQVKYFPPHISHQFAGIWLIIYNAI